MYEGSLFEKLGGTFSDIKFKDEETLYLSIANNLSNIFATNVGSVLTCPDYGKPELNDTNLTLEESLEKINKSLSASILKYEPRLHDVSVKAVTSRYNLSKIFISISGVIEVNSQSRRVEYEAFISGDGFIEVKR